MRNNTRIIHNQFPIRQRQRSWVIKNVFISVSREIVMNMIFSFFQMIIVYQYTYATLSTTTLYKKYNLIPRNKSIKKTSLYKSHYTCVLLSNSYSASLLTNNAFPSKQKKNSSNPHETFSKDTSLKTLHAKQCKLDRYISLSRETSPPTRHE